MFRLNASEIGLIQSVKNILCGFNKEASRRKEKISPGGFISALSGKSFS
jgi:hypothetical protein